MDFKLVFDPEDADADSIIVTLFLCPMGLVRGWLVGPIAALRDGGKVPYVPPSALMLGTLTLIRAHKLAGEAGRTVFVVDPQKLWGRLGKNPP